MARQTKKTLSNYLQTGETLILFSQAKGLTDRQTIRPAVRKKKIAQLDKSTRVNENDQQSTKQL